MFFKSYMFIDWFLNFLIIELKFTKYLLLFQFEDRGEMEMLGGGGGVV